MLLYYITDRKQFPGGETEQRRRVLDKIAEAARAGVEYIQLREKDLLGRALERLAREAVRAIRDNSSTTKLLINSRIDVALACGADGVHLTSTDIAAGDGRAMLQRRMNSFAIAVSTHSVNEAELAYSQGADFVVFGPVFEKVSVPARTGFGLKHLREVCAKFSVKRETSNETPAFPVLALGGITLENARQCVEAGAAGIAAIRLFQENDVENIVKQLVAKDRSG